MLILRLHRNRHVARFADRKVLEVCARIERQACARNAHRAFRRRRRQDRVGQARAVVIAIDVVADGRKIEHCRRAVFIRRQNARDHCRRVVQAIDVDRGHGRVAVSAFGIGHDDFDRAREHIAQAGGRVGLRIAHFRQQAFVLIGRGGAGKGQRRAAIPGHNDAEQAGGEDAIRRKRERFGSDDRAGQGDGHRRHRLAGIGVGDDGVVRGDRRRCPVSIGGSGEILSACGQTVQIDGRTLVRGRDADREVGDRTFDEQADARLAEMIEGAGLGPDRAGDGAFERPAIASVHSVVDGAENEEFGPAADWSDVGRGDVDGRVRRVPEVNCLEARQIRGARRQVDRQASAFKAQDIGAGVAGDGREGRI